MTARQFTQLGPDPAGVRLELFNGEIAVSPSPSPEHQFTVLKLAKLLDDYVEEHELGEVQIDLTTQMGKYNVPRPDILYFTSEQLPLLGNGYPKIAPTLCVEVISPGSKKTDRGRKFRLYAKRGVAHYWIVDPTRESIECYEFIDTQYQLCEQVMGKGIAQLAPFPKLKLTLKRLWRPIRE
jgi:Uma2 family endonuclease